ncbi:MAG TPA: lasso peptide biosynthesis B2 protein [Bacteroidales bacterium]|nr:lasso peptide biosynthesis B2 protein [Bacteroidales bacterium]
MYERVIKFRKLTARERMLFIEALILHLWVGLLLKVMPFRHIPKLFGNPEPIAHSLKYSVYSPQSAVIELVKNAIGRTGGISPWKNKCLVSSLAGRCMLRRRKIESQLSLGVAKDADEKTIAHAWLKAGDFVIVDKYGDFTGLYSF